MKLKKIAAIALVLLTATSCAQKKNKVPENWYEGTIDYLDKGFSSGWKNADEDANISDELRDSNNKFGYLLKDLNGDGADEVLVGLIDNGSVTKFTDIYVWHRDFGPTRIWSTGEGYYIYLCEDNILRSDSWYGSQTRTEYMKFNTEEESFLILSPDTEPTPGKYQLTPFN